jgi:hypothetical protein
MTTLRTHTIRQAGLILAFAVSIATLSSTSSFAFSADVQLGNPQHFKDHRLHVEEPLQPERRLPDGDGPRSRCPEVEQGGL